MPGDDPDAQQPSRAVAAWVTLALTVAGAALRLSTIDTRSFWLDETSAVRQAGWSIAEMLAWTAHNVHPPLFHTLLHFWMVAFGRSEVAVRLFATTWGIVAIPLAFWAARTFYSRRTALITTALVALSPFLIWYAQEARMYTMMLVFALVATAAMWRALDGRGWGWWLLYALATSAGLMTQYFFAFLVFGQALYFVTSRAHRRWREVLRWLAAVTLALAPYAWWLPKVFGHPELLRGVSGAFNYGGVPPVVGAHFNETILVPVQWLFGFHSELATRNLVAVWPLIITAVFLSAGLARRVAPHTAYLIAAGVGGVAAIVVLGTWQPIVLEARYFTAPAVPLVVVAARAIAEIPRPNRRVLAVGLLVVAAVCWADQSYNPDSVVKWDNRAAFGIVSDGFQPGDTILLIPYFTSSVPEYYLPPDQYAAVRQVPQFGANGLPRNTPAKLAEDLDRQVGPSRRVWVVATWQEIPRMALDRTLTGEWLIGQGFTVKSDRRLHRIRVTLYEVGRQRGFFLPGAVTP